jgi:hypothetical protein
MRPLSASATITTHQRRLLLVSWPYRPFEEGAYRRMSVSDTCSIPDIQRRETRMVACCDVRAGPKQIPHNEHDRIHPLSCRRHRQEVDSHREVQRRVPLAIDPIHRLLQPSCEQRNHGQQIDATVWLHALVMSRQ